MEVDIHNSTLRDCFIFTGFYKKLIQTDAQIRNLKMSYNDYTGNNAPYANKFGFMSDRRKRSLKSIKPKLFIRSNNKNSRDVDTAQFNLYFPPYSAVNTTGKKVKRLANDTEVPTGFVIEKKQILVQYKPNEKMRKVAKCSHTPKDSKSHETQLKHPFYKNTERLDELLDQFLDRNLPDMVSDPFGVEGLFKEKEKFKEIPHDTNTGDELMKLPYLIKSGRDDSSIVTSKTNDLIDKQLFNFMSKKKIKLTTTVSPYYNVLLSVSTIV
jgi:hypothetical protein